MTLSIMVTQPGQAHLIADGGVWDDRGICLGFGRKVALFPELNAAVAFAGFGGHAEWIEEAVERAGLTSTRLLLRGLPDLLREEIALHGDSQRTLKFQIITYDAEPGACGWLISSDDVNMPSGYQPFSLKRTTAFIDFGDPSAVLGREVDVTDPSSFDVVRDGAALAEAARITPWVADDGQPSYAVAGFADLYTVSSEGLTKRRLRDWPEDRIGERTNPFAGAALSA